MDVSWTSIENPQPGWSLEIGTLSEEVNSISVTQGVSNWQYPEVLTVYGRGGQQFLGYCEVFVGSPSGDCLVTWKADGTGRDYTMTINAHGIDFVELGAYGATGYPAVATTASEPSTALLFTAVAVAALAIAILKRAVHSIQFAVPNG